MNKSTFYKLSGLSKEQIERHCICLYHGIRFDTINRLESIFQTGYIVPSNKINNKYISYDGNIKYLYIDSNDKENCNKGKYISVMPYMDDIEFDTFIRENIFFAIKGTIDAYKTKYISYDEYCNLEQDNDAFYSYAHNEYFVENNISLDDIIYIGIDSRCFKGNYNEIVEEVINLINIYNIDIPFIDESNYKEIYRLNVGGLVCQKRKM